MCCDRDCTSVDEFPTASAALATLEVFGRGRGQPVIPATTSELAFYTLPGTFE